MAATLQEMPRHTVVRSNRRRGWLMILLLLVGVGLLIAGAVMVLRDTFGEEEGSRMITHRVARGDMLISVTENGNIESASNVDVKCQVAGGSTILWIVEDGTLVKKGDVLVRLDSAALEEQINLQTIVCEKAQATQIEAAKLFSAASLAVKEYEDGTFLQALQTAEANITIAMENLRSAENALQHAQRMARKGYITPLQRDAQAFAVERAKLELEAAETAKNVLVTFTKPKMLEDLQSARDTAAAKMRAEQAAYELEAQRLEKLKVQVANCIIIAPQDGMVVYATDGDFWGRSEGPEIAEGAAVREGQSLIQLPDLGQMQVNVPVHESKVEQVQLGMRANINVQGAEYFGSVTFVANQPDPMGRYSANVNKYSCKVRIDGRPTALKPGMTAQVEIRIDYLRDVLSVPVLAVVEQGGSFYCWVANGSVAERRPVVLGKTNSKLIEISDGLSEGEMVVLNPRAVIPEAREEQLRGRPSRDRFGTAPDEESGDSSSEASEDDDAAPVDEQAAEDGPLAAADGAAAGAAAGDERPARSRVDGGQ